MHELYKIEGTSNICTRETNGKEYNDPNYWSSFQEDYKNLKQLIIKHYEEKTPAVFLRIFDGEFHFLKGNKVGNVGRRHISKSIKEINLHKFKQGFLKADYVFTQIYEDFLPIYHSLFPSRKDIKPMEHIYALVANKWIFKNFKKIAIIGGEHKIKLIKKLMKYDEYKNYIGLDNFVDYISVPERFTCNNIDTLEKNLGEQIKNSDAKIFLFGIGIAKLAVAHTFKNYKNAIFIDIGCGISALAGTTSIERPYFGSWTNYRLKNHDYSGMDTMDYKDTKGQNEKILD